MLTVGLGAAARLDHRRQAPLAIRALRRRHREPALDRRAARGAAASTTSACSRRWRASRASSSCRGERASAPTRTRRCQLAARADDLAAVHRRRSSARRSRWTVTSACSTSAPAPATRRRCWRTLAREVVTRRADPGARGAARRTSTAQAAGRVEVLVGDGSLGVPERAPFDAIAVAAAAPGCTAGARRPAAPGGRLVLAGRRRAGSRARQRGDGDDARSRALRAARHRIPVSRTRVSSDAAAGTASLARVSVSTRAGSRAARPHNWIQLAKFGVVGASGLRRQPRRSTRRCSGSARTRPPPSRSSSPPAEQLLVEPPLDVRAPKGSFAYQGMRFFVVALRRSSSTSSGSFVFLDVLELGEDRRRRRSRSSSSRR